MPLGSPLLIVMVMGGYPLSIQRIISVYTPLVYVKEIYDVGRGAYAKVLASTPARATREARADRSGGAPHADEPDRPRARRLGRTEAPRAPALTAANCPPGTHLQATGKT